MQVVHEYHMSYKEEMRQTWQHYEKELKEALTKPSHLYDAMNILKLSEKMR